jgi:hypothetical protein
VRGRGSDDCPNQINLECSANWSDLFHHCLHPPPFLPSLSTFYCNVCLSDLPEEEQMPLQGSGACTHFFCRVRREGGKGEEKGGREGGREGGLGAGGGEGV